MSKLMSKPISLLLLTCVATGSAAAADLGYTPRGQYASGRHVVEIVDASTFGVAFIINGHINGHRFAPVSGACSGWTAGDGVTLLSGEWHGYCAGAVFRNTTRRRTCATLCNTW